MADKMSAIKAYSPSIKKGETVHMEKLVDLIAARTNFNEGTIVNVLTELRDVIIFYALSAQAVKFNGLGIFTPTVDLEGRFSVTYRPDKRLKNKLNSPDTLKGKIINVDMIGKTFTDLVERWNTEHPDDPIDLPKNNPGGGKKTDNTL